LKHRGAQVSKGCTVRGRRIQIVRTGKLPAETTMWGAKRGDATSKTLISVKRSSGMARGVKGSFEGSSRWVENLRKKLSSNTTRHWSRLIVVGVNKHGPGAGGESSNQRYLLEETRRPRGKKAQDHIREDRGAGSKLSQTAGRKGNRTGLGQETKTPFGKKGTEKVLARRQRK